MVNKAITVLCTALIVITAVSAFSQEFKSTPDRALANARLIQNISNLPLSFTQNNGQWPDSILFRAGTSRAALWFTSGAV